MVIDSSVFFEIFSDGPLRAACEQQMRDKSLCVPTMVLFEIYRKIKVKVSEDEAMTAVGVMRSYNTLDLTSEVALLAADLSLEYSLPMADSFVLAHAFQLNQPLLTLDNDFARIPGVIIIRKP